MRPTCRRNPKLFCALVAAMVTCACSSASNPLPRGSVSEVNLPGTPYELLTHCGIREARIGSTYYLADHPLSDGQGNPPPGWGNPYQRDRWSSPRGEPPCSTTLRDT